MTITAKFPGTCPTCNSAIRAGDKVEWSKGAKARHTACGASSSSTTRPQSSTAGRYGRPSLRAGDVYTRRLTGESAVFGCSDCSRLGRMCKQCAYDEQ